MREQAAHRYAVYFAPRVDSADWLAGSQWLGRCAARAEPLVQTPVPGLSAPRLQALTEAPRRYGWHATLKAPFTLRPSADETQLRDALRALCGTIQAFTLPPLRVTRLDDFLALVPEGRAPAIDAVAGACVTFLHRLATPLAPAELARRRAAALSAEEDALLLRWGYPFVLQRFRFHLSLTGSLRDAGDDEVDALMAAARQRFESLPPTRFDTLSLFAEPTPGADFRLLAQMELGA